MSQPSYPDRPTSPTSRNRWLRPTIETLVLILLMFLVIRSTLQNFHIHGHSMEPTLHDQEYMIVNKAAYLFQAPARGDIIVFRYPNDPSEDYVKRVIAIPGDTISVINQRVIVNDVTLQETYLNKDGLDDFNKPVFQLKVDPNDYFVMGDNRANSSDSRQWGFVPRDNIIGKAVMVYWPFGVDNFGVVPDMSHVFAKVNSP